MDSLGIDSLNDRVTDTPEEIESAWAAEIRRRVDAIKNGTADLLTVEEFEHFLDEA
jgi:putative addiction module component (TIGR02574 family)